jgi:hypothetical protein
MLEIAKGYKYKQTNHNAWSLFIQTNHRCNNRKATFEDLIEALDNWNNTEKNKYDCPLYFINFKDKEKDYIKKSCSIKENIENKRIICLMGQDWNGEYHKTGECLWYKIVIYDKKDNYYYLRSFAKSPKRGGDNKPLYPSRMEGWYIDYSTISAPAEFWSHLKIQLKESPVKLKSSISIEDKTKFWKEFNKIENRKELIEMLKKNLTDEEKLYLCECI